MYFEINALPIGNVLTSSVIPKFLGQSVINEEKFVTVSAYSHEKIVGFNVSVDEVFVMNEFNAAYHLVSQHQHRFHGEPSRAEIEQIFQRWPQQIHNQDVVVTFRTIPANVWNTNTT